MELKSIVVLLQIALQLLVGAQNGTPMQREQATLFAGNAINLAKKSLETVNTTPQVVNNYYYTTPTSTQIGATGASATEESRVANIVLKETWGNLDWDIKEPIETGYKGMFNIYLYDQNGKAILGASTTIVTDNPNFTGTGYGNNGETEINNYPEGHTTFVFEHANVGVSAYPFNYKPEFDGEHIITVSAWGVTKDIKIQSKKTP